MSKFKLNDEYKIRITTSVYSNMIIEEDSKNFDLKKTTLINRIIENYCMIAKCSLSNEFYTYRKELAENFPATYSSEYKDIMDKLAYAHVKNLRMHYLEKLKNRKDLVSLGIVTLSTRAGELLTEEETSREEDFWGINRLNKYISSLIEEYAEQPFYIREKTIILNNLETIDDAINRKLPLQITHSSYNEPLTVIPFKSITDPLSTYHYLVCLDYKAYEANHDILMRSYRTSRLRDVTIPRHTQKIDLSENEINMLNEQIKNRGVQFASANEVDIKIQLTQKGITNYNSRLHLRPKYIEILPNNIYVFRCTEIQVKFYFMNFGEDAKILEPESLAVNFKEFYSNAYKTYS